MASGRNVGNVRRDADNTKWRHYHAVMYWMFRNSKRWWTYSIDRTLRRNLRLFPFPIFGLVLNVSWLGKMAKSLFIFLFFSFILDLLHRRKCGKVLHYKCHTVTVTWQEVTVSHHMMSHDRHGKEVHRPCSSCISSIENPMGTLLSSLCQSLNKEQLALFQLGV